MANIHENTTKVYYALDEQMMAYHDNDDTRGKAEEIAHVLIKYADLPLVIRCRALCVLGCSDKGDYVHYAEQSVHFAKLGLAATQEDGGDETDGKTILEGCEEGLAAAKAAKMAADAKAATAASTEAAEAEAEQDDEEGDEEEDEEDEEEDDEPIVEIMDAEDEDEEDVDDEDLELVWDPDWDEERKAEAWAAQERLAAKAETSTSAPQATGKKTKRLVQKARRVHSGDTDNRPESFEVFDLAVNGYVPYGTALNPEMIEVDDDDEMLLQVEEGEMMLLQVEEGEKMLLD